MSGYKGKSKKSKKGIGADVGDKDKRVAVKNTEKKDTGVHSMTDNYTDANRTQKFTVLQTSLIDRSFALRKYLQRFSKTHTMSENATVASSSSFRPRNVFDHIFPHKLNALHLMRFQHANQSRIDLS